jgi:hypothetical protein
VGHSAATRFLPAKLFLEDGDPAPAAGDQFRRHRSRWPASDDGCVRRFHCCTGVAAS